MKSSNELTAVLADPACLKGVEILCINDQPELKKLPRGLCEVLKELREFVCFCNSLEEFPESLELMKYLTKLNLHDNRLTTVPESLGQLEKLEKLFLYNNGDDGNEITTIPTSIGLCKQLSVINISGNLLSSLPDELFTGCVNLSLLNVADNKITHLPASISSARNLWKLNLGENKVNKANYHKVSANVNS